MRNATDLQDKDDLDDILFDAKDTDHFELQNADLLRELDTIGTDSVGDEPPSPEAPRKRTAPATAFQDPDANDPDVIPNKPELTRYDKARAKRDEYQRKKDAILSKPVRSDRDGSILAGLNFQIEKAIKAMKYAEGDVVRLQESIDEWRAGPGREHRNASRRKTRLMPNADLSGMTSDEKAQYHRDRRSDSNFLKLRRDKGIPEPMIAAEYKVRLEERNRERDAARVAGRQAEADEAAIRSHPNFGLM